jgi:4-oxalocrotonate tautomerase
MPPAESRESQPIRHATRPYSVRLDSTRLVAPDRKERGMPLIDVKLYDRRINDEVVPAAIEKLTDAICEVIGEEIRGHTWVLVEGLSPKQWGIGGRPTDVTQTTQASA